MIVPIVFNNSVKRRRNKDSPAELPMVEACWLVTSAWLWTDSLESDERVPRVEPSLFKLLARLTIVATVRQ